MKRFGKIDIKLSLEEEKLEIEKFAEQENENQEEGLPVDEGLEVPTPVDPPPSNEEEPEPAADAAQVPASDTENSGERVTGDTETSETDKIDTKAAVSEDDADLLNYVNGDASPDLSDIVSTESLRLIMSKHISGVVGHPGLEDYTTDGYAPRENKTFSQYDNNDWSQWGHDHAVETGGFLKNSVRWLAQLGINLTKDTVPKLAKFTFKGLIYGFDKLAYGFMVGLTALDQYSHRRLKSFNNIYSRIKAAQHEVEMLKHVQVSNLNGQAYTAETVIRQLVVQDSIMIERHIATLSSFVNDAISGLGISIKEDIASIKELIAYSHISASHDVYKLLEIDLKMKNLAKGEIEGFRKEFTNILDSYHVTTVLPGNTVLIAHIPSTNVKDRDEWILAYKESDIFLGIDRSKFKLVDVLPYRSVEQLLSLLNQLESLCQICMKHQAFYEDVKHQKLNQRLAYKNYFDNIVKRHEKTSVKSSLIDLVTLKNSFIDKVYLPGAIDIHDYTVRVLSASLKYIDKNIKVLKH